MASTVGPVYETTKRTATNANLDIRTLMRKPRRVVVHNLTNNCRAEWNEALADDEAILTLAAGTRTLEAADGFTILAGDSTQPGGIRLGTLANINDTTTESLLFEFWG